MLSDKEEKKMREIQEFRFSPPTMYTVYLTLPIFFFSVFSVPPWFFLPMSGMGCATASWASSSRQRTTSRDYKDNNKKRVMCLHAPEFMRQFLLHVLPPRFVKVRYVGLLSNRTREENINLCRVILNIKPEDIPVKKEYKDVADFLLDLLGFDVRKCPVCNGRLVMKEELPVQYDIRAP